MDWLRKKLLCGTGAVAVLAWFAAAHLVAQTPDERTFFTFSGPVELPGVALPAGRYLFRLPEPVDAHDVVQVLSADGKQSYGMFFTMVVDRRDPSSEPEIRFMEAAAGAPPAIRTWWTANETTGREFIYPKEQAMRLAKNAAGSVLTTQAKTTKKEETNTASLSRVSSSGAETKVSTGTRPAASTPSGVSQRGESAPSSLMIAAAKAPPRNEGQMARTTLPKTGSALPLVGLTGLLALALAALVRFGRTRSV
jgi:hypothetical protein